MNVSDQNNQPVEIPVNGILDLHTFNPRDIRDLLPEYINACREKNIYEIRIIHGKGSGILRRTVHSILKKTGGVVSYSLADESAGGWGATIVRLNPENTPAARGPQ